MGRGEGGSMARLTFQPEKSREPHSYFVLSQNNSKNTFQNINKECYIMYASEREEMSRSKTKRTSETRNQMFRWHGSPGSSSVSSAVGWLCAMQENDLPRQAEQE